MKLVTGKQMTEIDRQSIEEIGVPGVVLMERAGMKVADAIREELSSAREKVIILTGRGNNGGDGFVIARLLTEEGFDVETVLLGTKGDVSGDAKINLDILDNLDYQVREVTSKDELIALESRLERADLVVDALLGTGIKGKLRGLFPKLIQMVNQVATKVVAVDIPSGVEAATGKVRDMAVRADKTVTFAVPKLGLILYPGTSYVGELEVVDIGLPQQIIDKHEGKIKLLTKERVAQLLPARDSDSHKGSYGKLLLVAGSTGMTGAATLATEASLVSGAGLVTLGAPAKLNPILEMKLTEAMTYPLADKEGMLARPAIAEIEELAVDRDVLAVGPGLSSGTEITEIMHSLIKDIEKPLVIDADGLNALNNLDLLKERKETTILTPHPGELARLIGKSISEIEENRLELAQEFALQYQVCLVLKGARTVIATSGGSLYLNQTGNSGLATGGSGDVLTGLIAGFLSQRLEADEAIQLAVYLHGSAADIGVQELTEYSLLPTDLLSYLPQAVNNLRR